MAYRANAYVSCNHTHEPTYVEHEAKVIVLLVYCTHTYTPTKKPQSHQEVIQNFLVKSRKACLGGQLRGGDGVSRPKHGGGRNSKNWGVLICRSELLIQKLTICPPPPRVYPIFCPPPCITPTSISADGFLYLGFAAVGVMTPRSTPPNQDTPFPLFLF